MVQKFDSQQVHLLRSLVLDELRDLSTYFGHLDEYVEKSERLEVQSIITQSGRSEAELSPRFWSYHYPVYWEDIFSSHLRSSVVVLSFTILEFHLNIVCLWASSFFDSPSSWRKPRRDVIKEAKKYLCKSAGIGQPDEKEWQLLLSHSIVRNCIVHNVGCVKDMAREKELKRFVKATEGLQIGQSDFLRIGPDYCSQLIQVLTTFFHHLYDGFIVKGEN